MQTIRQVSFLAPAYAIRRHPTNSSQFNPQITRNPESKNDQGQDTLQPVGNYLEELQTSRHYQVIGPILKANTILG
jgi:hypothetical protein